MKFKTFANAIALFIGLGLAAYSQLDKNSQQSVRSVEPTAVEDGQKFEEWQLKPGSIYDGDTLRVIRGQEELKIRFCGIDAPEKKQPLGIESRDYLRSLVEQANGKLLLVPIEKDRYDRTVAEVYAHDRRSSAINLNLQMVRDGYAWHYEKYSGNCPTGNDYAIAERLAKEEKLGVWNGSHQAPWDYRKANK
ncbi:thermonuclease family protein [Myxosarcina sp. GI1]|uniref:thermonuclease family protein n=1 Tax=Myxosarcina sp. GI1 TaxID=1541065 RepID=UPI00056397E9|nr:thermonuclease family protein [Myxosarcina sp. GI1]